MPALLNLFELVYGPFLIWQEQNVPAMKQLNNKYNKGKEQLRSYCPIIYFRFLPSHAKKNITKNIFIAVQKLIYESLMIFWWAIICFTIYVATIRLGMHKRNYILSINKERMFGLVCRLKATIRPTLRHSRER